MPAEVPLTSIVIACGITVLFFLTGFLWTWVLWERKTLDFFARVVFSLAISLAAVPGVIIVGDLIGVEITRGYIFIEILTLCVTAGIVYTIKNYSRHS